MVRKGGLEPPPAKADKNLNPEVSLLITISYNTQSLVTTRNVCTYKQPRSPRSVVSCCRELAFVEFKCTRSAPWRAHRCPQWGGAHVKKDPLSSHDIFFHLPPTARSLEGPSRDRLQTSWTSHLFEKFVSIANIELGFKLLELPRFSGHPIIDKSSS